VRKLGRAGRSRRRRDAIAIVENRDYVERKTIVENRDDVMRRNTVCGRRDFIKISTIKGIGTGRRVQFTGEMNIIKYCSEEF